MERALKENKSISTNRIQLDREWIFYAADNKKENIRIPHDAMIFEDRNAENPSGSAGAFFSGGKYKYEKNMQIPEDWKGKKITLEFEGVYKDASVYVNGKKAGKCAYGYRPFWVSIEEVLEYGEANKLQVIVDNENQPNSRWYSGSGIYRPVWMWIQEAERILPEGVRITTVSYNPASIHVETEHIGGEVSIEIMDGTRIVAEARGDDIVLEIPEAKLWSDGEPNMYVCRVRLQNEGQIVEERNIPFGIRVVEWSTKGLLINGKETLLRGGCIHHDNGLLGACSFDEAERRRIRILKNAGFNAIRSSHNPASRAMLEACDEYGMYLIDEMWDMWYNHKNAEDYAKDFMDNYREDIASIVKRDYNHPSVIFYSIGNEVSEPAEEKGLEIEKEMVNFFHDLDGKRAVTCGFNLMIVSMAAKGKGVYGEKDSSEKGAAEENSNDRKVTNSSAMFNAMAARVGTGMNMAGNSEEADRITTPGLDILDVAGYNYASGRYPLEGDAHPERIIYGSETFPQDIGKNWEMVKKYPYLIGDFMWTAWDYLGETGIGAWAYTDDGARFDKPYPWLLADTGVFDILGNENAEAGYASIVWGTRKLPYIGVMPANHPGEEPAKAVWRGTNALPSWSWRECDGNRTVVEVYADAPKVALFLNGNMIGEKQTSLMKAEFEVDYFPGVLEAVSYDEANCEIGRAKLVSASDNLSLWIEPEETEAVTDEIVYVPICLKDAKGVIESNMDVQVNVEVDNGELLAFGSANPRTEERYHMGQFMTYYGRAMAIVRCTEKGTLTITARDRNGLCSKSQIFVK